MPEENVCKYQSTKHLGESNEKLLLREVILGKSIKVFTTKLDFNFI